MSQGKVKIFKHPARNQQATYKPYVPQYQILGREPEEVASRAVPSGTLKDEKPQQVNPREKRPPMRQDSVSVNRQPYARQIPSPIGAGKGLLPNVGNNMEQTWSAIDGEISDDLSENVNQSEYIDNNDYVSNFALGISESEIEKAEASEDLFPIINDMQPNAHLLIVNGVPVCSGPIEEVQQQANALVFGEHPICDGNPVPVEDIIILKRVDIKVGLFLL